MLDLISIGTEIAERRKTLKLSQAALAREALRRCVFLDQPEQRAQRHLLLVLSREHPLDRRHPALDQLGDLRL